MDGNLINIIYMDNAIYTLIGFFSGALTCYFSYKLGSKTTYDAVYYEGPETIKEKREFESTPTDISPDQFNWEEYNSIVVNGPEEERKN